MTAVQLKLQDAGTQMKLAIANSTDEAIFRSCINSYISLARSVTFVMEENGCLAVPTRRVPFISGVILISLA